MSDKSSFEELENSPRDFGPGDSRDGNTNNQSKSDLLSIINLEEMQSFMDEFYKLTNLSTAIRDLDGRIIEATGRQDICTKFHRVNPESAKRCVDSDCYLANPLNPGDYKDYKCMNGLWNLVTPLYVEKKHMGNVYAGPFFYDDDMIDENYFMDQAKKFGFDKDSYLDAASRLPRFNHTTIRRLMRFLIQFATYIFNVSFIKLQLEKETDNRKLVDEAFQDQEIQLQTLINTLPDLVWLKDPDGVYLLCNSRFEKLFGADAETIAGKTDYDFVDKELADFFRVKDRTAIEKGRPSRNEEQLTFADGHSEILETIKTPMYRGNQIIGVLGIGRDITERIRSEEKERTIKNALILDEQRLEALLELSQMTNATLKEITDFTLEEAVKLTRSKIGYLAFMNDSESVLTMHSWSKSAMKECAIRNKPINYNVEETGLWGECIRQRKPVITNNYAQPSPLKKGVPKGHVLLIRHMNIPFFDGDKIVAVIGVGNKEENYEDSDIRQLRLMMQGLWRLIQRKKAEDSLKLDEKRLKALVTLNQMTEASIDEISHYGLEVALEITKSSIGFIGTVSENETKITMHAWSNEVMKNCAVLEKTLEFDIRESGIWADALRLRKPVICNDYPKEKSPFKTGLPHGHVPVYSYMGVPIFESDTITAIAVVGNKPEPYSDTDIRQMTLITQGIWRLIQRKKTEEELKTTRNYLRNIFNSVPSMLISINDQGDITQWNTAAEKYFKRYKHKVISKNIWEIIPFFNGYRDKIEYVLKEKIVINLRHEDIFEDEKKYLDITISPTRYAGSNSVVIRMDDKTEMAKKDAQLIQSQKMETVGTLAGGLSHDFNNVLAGIVGTISLMKHKLKKNGQIKADKLLQYVSTIQESANRAESIVSQLLALSRKSDLRFSPVDLNNTIKHVLKICENSFDKSITLDFNCYDEPAMIKSDPTQIEQILLNLCINAAHAMTIMRESNDSWGGKLTLSIDKIHADEHFCKIHSGANKIAYVKLSIHDTGIGMKQEIISKIFDPFFTTKERGRGTGLGLAMVYNIIKKHCGFIDVYSEMNIGSIFNIFIPLLENGGAELQTLEDESIRHGSGVILLVDDEATVRELARLMLEECGYDVISAENGKQGFDIFRQQHDRIDAVLLDMIMPKMSGYDVYKKMKEIDPEIKVLLASGFKRDKRVEEAMSLGANAFIQKPFTLKDLSDAIWSLIYK